MGKNGPRLQASPPDTSSGSDRPRLRGYTLDKDGVLIVPPGHASMMTAPPRDGVVRLTGAREGMESLCTYLSRQLQQPVKDRPA